MTSAEKIQLLKQIFRQGSNQGVQTWGPTKNGYRWNCDTRATAERLAEFLLSNVQRQASFPHRFDTETTLIIEPFDD